ncbi:MAG: collagen-like protein [Victivallaceae bacterium]
MQKIKFCVAAGETVGMCCDLSGVKSVSAPQIVMGAELELNLLLFAGRESNIAYDFAALSGVKAWRFVMDNDYDATTTPKIAADHANITLEQGSESYLGEFLVTTLIKIPILNTLSSELISAIGNKNKIPLNGELSGYDEAGKLIFVLQILDFSIMNRIAGNSDPVDLPLEYLNETQVRALLAAGFEVVFSGDGLDWHEIQSANDKFFRFRLAGNESGDYSSAVELPAGVTGPQGIQGKNGAPGMDGAPGIDGLTPHIDNLTNHWFLGEEDLNVNASGALWQIPRTWYTYQDSEFGVCNRLDATIDTLTFGEEFYGLAKIKLFIRSASATVGGNIKLNFTLTNGGSSVTVSKIIPVNSAGGWLLFDLADMSLHDGVLNITRVYLDAADTLKDGGNIISAVVTAVRFLELH